MDFKLQGKVAFIGGGSKGLGKGCALALAQEGVNVAICARGAEALAKTAEFIKQNTKSEVLPIESDLSNVEDVKRAIEKTISTFGKIDVLVTNSGGPAPGKFFDFNEEDWENAFHSVLRYVIQLYNLIIPGMKQRKWGRIINLTSLAVKEPSKSLILSNVFRSGVVSLAKSLSRELIQDNITINNLCPGAFKTERAIHLMKDKAEKTGISIEEIEKQAVAGLPSGRYQKPEELGALVSFLCSEQAGGITGTTIQIDGGISKGLL